jgi:RNA polymerase Rpb4
LNPRAALLSNYEVLELLRELEADHIARTRTAQRLKKEEDDAAAATGQPPPPSSDPLLTVSENLRTIEVEVCSIYLTSTTISHYAVPKAIQYLSADYQPTRAQTAQAIQRLTKNLAPFGLTKAEKLQVVNLTPVEPVELYVVRGARFVSPDPLYSRFLRRSSRSWKTGWETAWKRC